MKTIIFDFDGTIANSFEFVVNFLIKKAGKSPIEDPAEFDKFRKLSMIAIARLQGIPWYRLPFLLVSGRQAMARNMKAVEPFKGMPELIRQLHNDGYQLIIVSTNTATTIKRFLVRHELDDCFDRIIGNIGVFGKAPALRRLIRARRLVLADCVYIGDEIRDVEASHSINLACIAVTWGFAGQEFLAAAKPTALVDTPEELALAIAKHKNL
jgi:phosphoglycolate phosphatase